MDNVLAVICDGNGLVSEVVKNTTRIMIHPPAPFVSILEDRELPKFVSFLKDILDQSVSTGWVFHFKNIIENTPMFSFGLKKADQILIVCLSDTMLMDDLFNELNNGSFDRFEELINRVTDDANPKVDFYRELGKLNNELTNMHREIAKKNQELINLNAKLELMVEQKLEELRFKDNLLNVQNKQAALGEMIGNIAHQWKQPLNSLSLLLQVIRQHYADPGAEDDYIQKKTEKGMALLGHLSDTIDDFRDFFKMEKEAIRFSVSDVIKKAVSLSDSLFSDNRIKLVLNFQDEIEVTGFPSELGQVFLNLFNNAKDAFVAKAVKQRVIRVSVYRGEEASVAEVADNAGGIPSEILEKVGAPYFTTKDTGTGIGLYMSRVIVERHFGGKFQFYNGNDGAVFQVLLPH